jgi:hypothetical protein
MPARSPASASPRLNSVLIPPQDGSEPNAAALTLGVVIPRYLAAKQDLLRPNSYNAAKRYLEQHWKPLHGRPLEAIKRADVAARLQETTKAFGRTSAARGRDNLSALYSWAVKEGLCEANPVLATNDPTEGIQARDRVLNDDEIRAIWNTCEDDVSGRIVKLLLLTGCRREEIGARRSTIATGISAKSRPRSHCGLSTCSRCSRGATASSCPCTRDKETAGAAVTRPDHDHGGGVAMAILTPKHIRARLDRQIEASGPRI